MSFAKGFAVSPLTASSIQNFAADVIAIASTIGGGGGGLLQVETDGTNITGNGQIGNPVTLNQTVNILDLSASYVDFKPLANAPAPKAGRTYYDSASGDLTFNTDVQNFLLRIGQQEIIKVVNNTGALISKGKIVYVSGSAGSSNNLYVYTASWEGDLTSARTIGLTAHDIGIGATGIVVMRGIVEGLDTQAYQSGQALYLSSSGDYTTVRPVAPKHEVRVGNIGRAQHTNGSIFVYIQNGYELDELHDVLIQTASAGDLFVRSSDNLWKNTKQLSGSYTITGSLTASQGISLGGLTIQSSSLNGGQFLTSHGIQTQFLRSFGYLIIYGNTILGDAATDVITISGSLNALNGISGSITGSQARFTTITGSFSGSGANITNITASNIPNFTNDVRSKISGSKTIKFNQSNDGVIKAASIVGQIDVIYSYYGSSWVKQPEYKYPTEISKDLFDESCFPLNFSMTYRMYEIGNEGEYFAPFGFYTRFYDAAIDQYRYEDTTNWITPGGFDIGVKITDTANNDYAFVSIQTTDKYSMNKVAAIGRGKNTDSTYPYLIDVYTDLTIAHPTINPFTGLSWVEGDKIILRLAYKLVP